ncbi:MAG: cell division protein ZapA [Lachnospiraceae bacterium]|jgi:cell division protein ZapA
MAVKNTTQVLIGGKIITLSGYESKEYLEKVASYLNHKITELSELPGYNRQSVETKHTLLSLNVSDDYFKAKKQAEIFEEDLQSKDKEMYDLKHELISAQVQLNNLKNELYKEREESEQLKREIERLQKK